MLGAYFAYQISEFVGFYPALIIAPLVIAFLGALVEKYDCEEYISLVM